MENKIYAVYNEKTIRVYQAYNDAIADEALKLGTFGKKFKMNRMTWIKPSFLWMMYRSGWAAKDNQTRVLAIDIQRQGFDYIVNNSILSIFSKEVYGTIEHWEKLLKKSEIRCQWDPDRDIFGRPLKRKAIQLGIKGSITKRYINEWIVSITDITKSVKDIKIAIIEKKFSDTMLPVEHEYI